MTSPRSCLKSITTALKRLAHKGDVASEAYVRSHTSGGLHRARSGASAERYAVVRGRGSIVRSESALSVGKAHIHPLPSARRRPGAVIQSCAPDWPTPTSGREAMTRRPLASLVTVGSARLAKIRHLGAPATDHRQKASYRAVGARQLPPVRPWIASVTRCEAAF
jgi:hypothetical protein